MRLKSDAFEHRHIGPNAEETRLMLQTIGVESIDELINQTVPANIRRSSPMTLPKALTEEQMLEELKRIGAENKLYRNYIGQGYYGCFTPGVILRNILENPGWYTQYTPYQAEIAQGRLEALLNFQTMVTDLTGLDIANASLLDEATAAAEAMTLVYNERPKNQGNKFFVDHKVFLQTIDVLHTRSIPQNIEIEVGDIESFKPTSEYFGALVQYPDAQGSVRDFRHLAEICHNEGLLVCAATDILALPLLPSPGSWGADVAFGSTQRFGVPMGYGGPYAAFFATKEKFKRQIPGRLIGVSIDSHGNRALRMALQTREQHIRREKASSNICTAQVLLAIMSSMYAVYHGAKGIRDIAMQVHVATLALANELKAAGLEVVNDSFFDTLTIRGVRNEDLRLRVEEKKINLFYLDDEIRISLDETVDARDLSDIFYVLTGHRSENFSDAALADSNESQTGFPLRNEDYLQQEVFNKYQSETDMLRYIKHLENKDLSLAHSMIALGSCTMKLNATTEMRPVTWPEFGSLHPFAPREQAQGYTRLFDELAEYLQEITGFAGISFQPNSGAQGEYAGLMVIREYLKSRGESHRNVALIPSSAHGTNPASAVMAGMKVVVTKCDEAGNIDLDDLKAKAAQHKDDLACIMVTYPSTHGVFEETIIEICQLIHEHGGQVYMDGANMNAQVGLTSPGLIGADVCHLNLHKTFCIPHGGGGPGMGPIGVAEHLVPFLPGHAIVKIGGESSITAVSAAPWGSASILLISYAYIRMMGEEGLTNATKYAILNANYIKARLEGYYETLYSGMNNRCAHEMILDTRRFKSATGIEVEDIAKRLIDYGFHAPTVSFPVAGTLMVEPTESESKAELDRFCDAMISIRKEIDEINDGLFDKEDNVLKNAPHTAAHALSDAWEHAYTRNKAVYPLDYVRNFKFWPSVGRVNNSYGDRNLICVCPPIEHYETVEE